VTFRERIQRHMERYKGAGLKEGDFTIGAFVSAVLEIDNAVDAAEFHAGYLAFMRNGMEAGLPGFDPRYDPIHVAKANIGWCFGEGMAPERMAMWRDVCEAEHPVFGAMTVPPTPEEAFRAGLNMGKGWQR
jgi:hypothetical protein